MSSLVGAIMLQDIEPAEERVALTGLAGLISGPLAYAVPIVRLQREREQGEIGVTGTRRRPRVGPLLVPVPPLKGQPRGDAVSALERLDLKPVVDLHESSDKDLDKVIVQEPAEGTLLTVGSRVKLSVGNGPSPAPEETLGETLRGLRDDVAQLRKDFDATFSSPPLK